MRKRYLFGPIDAVFADEHLHAPRAAGECLAFNATGEGVDLAVGPADHWPDVSARLPGGWQPDFVALHMGYNSVVPAFYEAPVPLVALANDWNFLWHWYRHALPHFEIVLTDAAGVDVMRRQGLDHARYANLYGPGRSHLEMASREDDGERDIDLLFVGNMQPAVQRQRLRWLGRLAGLADRWNVVIRTGVFGDDYRALLRRAKIVFNRSVRGECNQRAFEAACAGALLLQEASNREVPEFFAPGSEYVEYADDDLEKVVAWYLEKDAERRAIANAARRRVRNYAYHDLWCRPLDNLTDGDWEAIRGRAVRRNPSGPLGDPIARTWQAVVSRQEDPGLAAELKSRAAEGPASAALHNALGMAAGLYFNRRDAAAEALGHFQNALGVRPGHTVAALNVLEAHLALGDNKAVIEGGQRLLAQPNRADEVDPSARDACHFPPIYDQFRIEWEAIAWRNAGDPAAEAREKANLVRWRVHALVAELTGDLPHFLEAALAWPELSLTRAALGCALGRAGRPAEAAVHLEHAVRDNPIDGAAARAYAQALIDSGDGPGFVRLARARRLLARAAPGLVPADPLFFTPEPAPERMESQPLRVLWEGPFADRSSFALSNRELCQRLNERGHTVGVLVRDRDPELDALPPPLSASAAAGDEPLARETDVRVRMEWPPRLTPPASGRWVVYQPWEFGSIPRKWLRPLAEEVDEVWAPSWYVRDCYVASGIPADRVHVVPHGVDPERFRPGLRPLPLSTTKRCKFLFVGGTIPRKGIDVLLEAYSKEFTRADEVCLVIKDMGGGSFYRGQTAESAIARLRDDPAAPEIEYLTADLSDEDMPSLYAACDSLVHPYRGEGFGLPILEAMACGLPVIVTDYGAARDFCDATTAYLVPAHVRRFASNSVGKVETVGEPWLAEPDAAALRHFLRRIVDEPEAARAKGRSAAERVRTHFTWVRAAQVAESRLRVLCRQPIRRASRRPVATEGDFSRPIVVETAVRSVPRPSAPRSSEIRQRISLCMIVKNEQANLGDCLVSAADLFDEVIVVDTGSQDSTREIAARHGARVFDFAWCDNFAAARNESLRHATGDWCFWLDADDRLDEENRGKLRALFEGLRNENAAYVVKCLCVPDAATGTATVVDHVRLFRNRPDLRWTYRVHEQILPAVRRTGGDVRWCDVVVRHTGYQDQALRRRKLERDLRLLRLENAEKPDDPFTLFNFGQVAQELGRHAEAIPLLRRSLERSHPKDSIVRKIYALLAGCHRQLGQSAEALAACREGMVHYPDDAELLFVEAILLREQGDLPAAESSLRRCLEAPRAGHFASVDAGLSGYKARQNLAIVCQQQGRLEEAEEQFRQAIAERPDFVPARLGLADVFLAQKRWTDLDEVAEQLAGVPGASLDAELLRARGHLSRQEFDSARVLLQRVIEEAPRALAPRVLYSHACLQEGADSDAAERALLAVLELAPEHAEARSNLAVLRQKREHARAAADAGSS